MNRDHEMANLTADLQTSKRVRSMPQIRTAQVAGDRKLETRHPGPKSGWIRKKAIERRLPADLLEQSLDLAVYDRHGIRAISTVVMAKAPNGPEVIPQYHISFSLIAGEARATDRDCAVCLASFHLTGADEDNHEPGRARHFWMPLDPRHRVECECKDETIIVEPDGHRWSTPRDGSECYGCNHEADMRAHGVERPCTIHGSHSIKGLLEVGPVREPTMSQRLHPTLPEGWGESPLVTIERGFLIADEERKAREKNE